MRTFLLRGEPAAKVKSFGEMGLEKALLNALRFFLFLRFSGSDAHHHHHHHPFTGCVLVNV